MANDMNVAFGLEWREEGYEVVKGDTPSWTLGPYAGKDPHNMDVTATEAAAALAGGATAGSAGTVAGCFIPGLAPTPGTQCNAADPIFNALPVFETPSYRPVYVISDTEMKELKKNHHQEELDEITTQRKRLEDAFKSQLKHLEEREKEVKNELKLISGTKGKA
jgi:hypothetical protein